MNSSQPTTGNSSSSNYRLTGKAITLINLAVTVVFMTLGWIYTNNRESEFKQESAEYVSTLLLRQQQDSVLIDALQQQVTSSENRIALMHQKVVYDSLFPTFLKVVKMINPGVLEEESILLQASNQLNLADFAIVTRQGGDNVSGFYNLCYELPGLVVNNGDIIRLYTKEGQLSIHDNLCSTKTYNFYWGFAEALFTGDGSDDVRVVNLKGKELKSTLVVEKL